MPVLSRSIFFAVLSALLIVLGSCSSSSTLSNNGVQPSILNCRIAIGESGGFTGGGTGFIIDSTGVVWRFEGIMASAAPKTDIGRLTPEQISAVNILIAQLPHTKYSERGNLTSYLSLSEANENRAFSWPGTSPGPGVPEPVSRLYYELKTIIDSL